jgi:hypothetical protein
MFYPLEAEHILLAKMEVLRYLFIHLQNDASRSPLLRSPERDNESFLQFRLAGAAHYPYGLAHAMCYTPAKMSVRRKLVKTPLGVVEYLWLEGGLVPFDVLMQEWRETLFQTYRVPNYPKAGEVTPKTQIASYS